MEFWIVMNWVPIETYFCKMDEGDNDANPAAAATPCNGCDKHVNGFCIIVKTSIIKLNIYKNKLGWIYFWDCIAFFGIVTYHEARTPFKGDENILSW